MRSSDPSRQKIVIVGPCEAGKSTLANVLAEASESVSEAPYRPTAGARILECESEVRTGSQRVTVELWDASGDAQKFQKCWPAIKQDAVGVILVYNPEKEKQEQEIEQWFGWFPRAMNMSPSQVLVVQSLRRSDMPAKRPLPAKLANAGVAQPLTVTTDDLVSARKHFGVFLETVRQEVMNKQRQEEEAVMQSNISAN
jgi:GTPase SAR1 family protein